MFKRNKETTETKEKAPKEKRPKRPRVIKMGPRKVLNTLLWCLLIGSVVLGVYNNFTATDTHTVHEVEKVELRYVNTNRIERFVESFAQVYYSWELTEEGLEARTEQLANYLSSDLLSLNANMVRTDIPVSAQVDRVQIWDVTQLADNQFSVMFAVTQRVTETLTELVTESIPDDTAEGGTRTEVREVKTTNESTVLSYYSVIVYVDDEGRQVIIHNPTISSPLETAEYTSGLAVGDGSVNSTTSRDITDFLETFFALYPAANEKELSYYVKDSVLRPADREYIFQGIISPVYTHGDNGVIATFSVSFLDTVTKTTQISQYTLTLTKSETGNWIVVDSAL